MISGDPLSRAVRESHLFPPLVASMLSVAERTGQLEPALAKAAAYFQHELLLAAERLGRIIEPVVLGVLMALFMLIFFLPIYSSVATFGG